jgi:cyclopropane fatty-acyl-phospholipid synthase-like methyltransferase
LDSSEVTKLVATGYDQIADSYLQQFGHSAVRARKLNQLVELLPSRAHVLDLGCGAGVPVARDLIARGFEVTGVDASARQIERARCNAPQAQFIQADMTTIEFPAFSFDAVAAFYSITHIPRGQHAAFLTRLAQWLRSGGWFLASFGATALDDWVGDWLGTTMFFSHYDGAVTHELLSDAGLLVQRAEVLQQDNEETEFLWITARTP